VFTCADCGKSIKRHIYPSEVARRRHLFCNHKCSNKFQKKKPKPKIKRLGVSPKRRPIKDTYIYSSKKPVNCPAKVEFCLDCPYPAKDCKY
jgi:hypothetical protein